MALQGFVDEISRGRVAGWCFDPDQAETPVQLEVVVNGGAPLCLVANRPRPDVDAHLSLKPGSARGFEFEFDPPLSVFRGHQIEIRTPGNHEILPYGRRTLKGRRDDSLRPLLVTSVGRSGSTMLMREFVRHPGIVVADLPPYEIKLLSYYASAFRTLVADEDRRRSTDPTTMFVDADRFRIGHNPWNRPAFHAIDKSGGLSEFFETTIPNRFADIFRKNVSDYYKILKSDQKKSRAIFFAEKGDIYPDARDGARLFFPDIREIVLLRDPRDLLCSAREFWKLSTDEALEMLHTTLPMLEQIHREAGPEVMFLRYEDLIQNPVETRKALCQFIGVDWCEGPLENDDNALREAHGTSISAHASVGRWRDSLSEESAAACVDLFGSFIKRFGYQNSPNSAHQPQTVRIFVGASARSRLDGDSGISDGLRWPKLRPAASWTFSAGGKGRDILLSGWSKPEGSAVWSDACSASLTLPPMRGPGIFILRLLVKPYIAGPQLPRQRLLLYTAGRKLAEYWLDQFSVVECELPRQGEIALALQIDLALPDAFRPCDLETGNADTRQLGICLEGVTVFSTAASPLEAATGQPQNSDTVRLPADPLLLEFQPLNEDSKFALAQQRTGSD